MKVSIIILIASLLVALGGWMATLATWVDALTPIAFGGLIAIVGSVLLAWLGESPRTVLKRNGGTNGLPQ